MNKDKPVQKDAVAIIGTGNIGSVIARLSAQAGYDVLLSNSRGPETLRDLATQIGPTARAVTVAEAIKQGDIIVLSVPFGMIATLPPSLFEGKLVVDATNYIPLRDGDGGGTLPDRKAPAEIVQGHLSGARVVKAFNNIYSGHLHSLSRPSGASDRSALPIAGNDEEATSRVEAFLDDLGWDAVDVGPLARSILFDVETPVFVKAYMADQSGCSEEWGSRITSDPGKCLPAAEVSRLVGDA